MRVPTCLAASLVALPLGLGAQSAADSLRTYEQASATQPGPINAYNAAALHARMGHTDSAFAWLRQALQRGWIDTARLKSDTDLESVRHDPRFAPLVADAAKAAAPCLYESDRKRFAFWIGQWTVTTKGGYHAGDSRVESVSNGCGLLENWTGTSGGRGKSLNTYSPAAGQWQQYWVGSDGSVTYYQTSTWHDGAITFMATAPDVLHRLTFAPLADGTVRQLGELSNDGGKSWAVSYDLYYHRAP